MENIKFAPKKKYVKLLLQDVMTLRLIICEEKSTGDLLAKLRLRVVIIYFYNHIDKKKKITI